MNGNQIYRHLDAARVPAWWEYLVNADWRLRNLQEPPAAAIALLGRLRMMSWFFCLTVWLSSLAAIWMSRGWIGLFVSGHLLSAGASLFKSGEKAQAAVSLRAIEPRESLEGTHDGL
jgi:hypothetical protein